MASFQSQPSSMSAPRPSTHAPTPMASSNNAPPGTFAPGTKVQVGSHRVIVEKYLSEGGFAHVYVVRVPLSSGKTTSAVLKRVAVPDKETLANMRTEVETMKKLKGHKHIVTYIDSHASQLKGGGYEVFLLMEYCDGGGLIDFMNTRLKNRLTEPEILKIFSDSAEGVACMHYLKPPLLHRDLKVENILISNTPSSKLYKLCDFGSSAPPRPAATSAAEGRLIEDDVQRHTTLQYRSPEMIDVYQKRPIDEKSDIWALGVLLYKLCYYTTPFEEQGQMAILTASFKYPGYPKFSDDLKKLIASMLMQDPRKRPNIHQVLSEVCRMRGTEVPIKDIYATRSLSEARNNQQLPSPDLNIKSPPQIGAFTAPPEEVKQELPEITPMRRGRPTPSTASSQPSTGTTAKSNKDPFAALDSPSFATRSKAVDELSGRFPPAEQFSLLQDRGSTFQFGTPGDKTSTLNERVTNALADEVFAKPTSTSTSTPTSTAASSKDPNPTAAAAKAAALKKERPQEQPKIQSLQSPPVVVPAPQKPKMVSTGTMTSQDMSPRVAPLPLVKHRPIWRVPPPKPISPSLEASLISEGSGSQAIQQPERLSTPQTDQHDPQSLPMSSRRSLEGNRPPLLDLPRTVHRSKSAEESSFSPTKSSSAGEDAFTTDYRRDTPSVLESREFSDDPTTGSDVDSLRAREEEKNSTSYQKRSSSANRLKHTSLPPMPKHVSARKISSVSRRFEAGNADPISSRDKTTDVATVSATGSTITEATTSNFEDNVISETEELSPEMRRDLERRRLSIEEKRVANAAAAYRKQMVNGGTRAPGLNRASTIQSRVASLLDESGREAPVKKTAEGYGKYTDAVPSATENILRPSSGTPAEGLGRPVVDGDSTLRPLPSTATAPNPISLQRSNRRPIAPPKPKAFRIGEAAPVTASNATSTPGEGAGNGTGDDIESDFSKRYPSLSLDLVETEIEQSQSLASSRLGARVKDV